MARCVKKGPIAGLLTLMAVAFFYQQNTNVNARKQASQNHQSVASHIDAHHAIENFSQEQCQQESVYDLDLNQESALPVEKKRRSPRAGRWKVNSVLSYLFGVKSEELEHEVLRECVLSDAGEYESKEQSEAATA